MTEWEKIARKTADILRPILMKENDSVINLVQRVLKSNRDLTERVERMEDKLLTDPKCPTCGRKN